MVILFQGNTIPYIVGPNSKEKGMFIYFAYLQVAINWQFDYSLT